MRTTKAIYITALLALFGMALGAQIEEWQWVLPAGGNSEDYAISVTADNLGNSYVTGSFRDTLLIGSSTLISDGEEDIFIAKADPDGNWLWAKKAGSAGNEYVSAITLDADNNVFITGIFYDPATFGDFTLTSNGNHDIFVIKLDPNGNWVWALSAGGIYSDDVADITSDAAGNLYLVGTFLDTVVFGSTTLNSFGGCDIFAAKIDPAGNWVWSVQAGSDIGDPDIPFLPIGDFGTGIALDDLGNVFLIGNFLGAANFGTWGVTSVGDHDVCVAKLDPSGNWIWVRRAGGNFADWGHKIVTADDGDVYVTGYYMIQAEFGNFVLNAFANTHPEVFIARISSEGTWLWARRAGGDASISLGGIALDNYGSLFLTGSFYGNSSFGDMNITSLGLGDIYLAKLAVNGDWLHVIQAGGPENDQGMDVCIDHANIFITGAFSGSAQFGDLLLSSTGLRDIFIARIIGYTPVLDEIQSPSALFRLGQNHPNPFNPSTTISFEIRAAADSYTLRVYDIRGRRVATLVEGFLSPGRQGVVWDGTNDRGEALPSGIYFYRLSGAAGSITNKMILCK